MFHIPNLPRLLREAVVDVKRALQGLHEGPGAKPRERVYSPLGVGKDLYSKWLNTEEPDRLPPLAMFMAIGNISDNPEPLAALARHWGSGYRVLPLEGLEATPAASQQILADHAGPSGSLSAGLAGALGDDQTPGVVDMDEALRLLPDAEENALAAQRTVEKLRRIALGRS
jgi:hypothetical protein